MLKYTRQEMKSARQASDAALDQEPRNQAPPAQDEPQQRVLGTLIGVRLQPDLLVRLDIHRQGLTRPEAIRRMIEKALA